MNRTRRKLKLLPTAFPELFRTPSSYRLSMDVTEAVVFDSPVYGKTCYYVCPRCKITMEREFVAYCDRCGQHLSWKRYRAARVRGPGGAHI